MTKKEQLKIAFKTILTQMVESRNYKCNYYISDIINMNVNELIKEVSIRTPLK